VSDPAEHFRLAIAAAGLTPPDHIEPDGVIHRFSTSGRRGDDSGWYALHLDGVPAGSFGCWREGLQSTWCSKAENTLTPAEREAHRTRVKAMQAQREAEQVQRQQEASQTATARWNAATPATEHPYLSRKGIQPHGTRTEGEVLLIPMRDTASALHSLEIISPNGEKWRHAGGRVTGCYHGIGKPVANTLIVCEGFATGATVHEATGHAVAVAFNAGNLGPVAGALRIKYPRLKIILASDDDWQTEGNPGLSKAREAASAVDGWLAVPTFPADRPDKATDFNDLAALVNLDAVRSAINAALPVEQAASAAEVWPDPTPLPDALPPVQAFDAELLPEALRGWVADIAHRMQCPVDFPAVGAVVAISSLIGARVVVAPKAKDDWRVVPNLWGVIVGRPGVMKSPALGEVLKPLNRLESAERELWQAEHGSWTLDCKVADLAADANEKKAKGLASKDPSAARALLQPVESPDEPKARRYVVNDATVEKLGELLTDNPWGTLSYRDELHGLLTSMDRQGQEGARAFYLQAYDGNQGYTVDRIGRGTHHIPRVCLSMLGGMQPGKVQSYVRDAVGGGAGDDGLLQRFGLAVWPDVRQEFVYVDRWPDTPAKQAAWAVFERLNAQQPAADDTPHEWRFTPAAQALFEEWLIPFETELRGDALHPALVSHLSKYRKLIPALALIFALVDTPDAGGQIGETELIRALAWGEYLRSHAERLYAAAVVPETSGAQTLLTKIKTGKLCDGDGVLLEAFTPRLVAVKSWTGLGTPDLVRKAADLLADYGWLARETSPSGARGGRPSERYLIHPNLLRGGRS
jgi:putative DNA primase/helicase